MKRGGRLANRRPEGKAGAGVVNKAGRGLPTADLRRGP